MDQVFYSTKPADESFFKLKLKPIREFLKNTNPCFEA